MHRVKIGNDIVDLFSEPCLGKYQNPRFLDKICSKAEHRYIDSAKDPHVMLWTLWAIKEASYKALMKAEGRQMIRFIPNRFECARGAADDIWTCRYQRNSCLVKVETSPGYVHAVAWTGDGEEMWKSIAVAVNDGVAEENHSTRVRKLAEQLLAEAGFQGCKVVRDGPPMVYKGELLLERCDISLSHDGQYVAAVIINKEA